MIEQGQIVDIKNRRIYKGEIVHENGKIVSIVEKDHHVNHYIIEWNSPIHFLECCVGRFVIFVALFTDVDGIIRVVDHLHHIKVGQPDNETVDDDG